MNSNLGHQQRLRNLILQQLQAQLPTLKADVARNGVKSATLQSIELPVAQLYTSTITTPVLEELTAMSEGKLTFGLQKNNEPTHDGWVEYNQVIVRWN
jgi:hypothetical protein